MGVQYNLLKFEWFIFVFVVSYGTGKNAEAVTSPLCCSVRIISPNSLN